MYFLRKVISHFLPKGKISCCQGKNTIFPDNTRKIMSHRRPFLKRPSFQKIWIKCHIFVYFFWERSPFIFRLRCKIILLGKETWSFPTIQERSYSRAIFFRKTIFLGRLEKENLVFHAVLPKVPRAKFLGSNGLFCFISICKFGSFKNPFAMITSLSVLYFRFRRYFLLVEMKVLWTIQWKIQWAMVAARAAENHGEEWGLIWYLQWGIYTSVLN